MGEPRLGDVQPCGERYFEARFLDQTEAQIVLFAGPFTFWGSEIYNKAGLRLWLSAPGANGAAAHLFADATPEDLTRWVKALGGTVYAPLGADDRDPAGLDLAGRVPAPLDAPWQPLALGELIDKLKGEDPEEEVRFDFGGFIPRNLGSYRGSYDQLALGYDDKWQEPMTVGELQVELRQAVGRTYEGYKGGDYEMTRTTPVWAASSGDSWGTGIVGVRRDTWVILETVYIG